MNPECFHLTLDYILHMAFRVQIRGSDSLILCLDDQPSFATVDLDEMSAEIGRLRERLGAVEETAAARIATFHNH